MATNLAKLVVQLEAQSSKLQRDLDKANKSLSRFERQATTAAKRVKSSLTGIGAGIVAGLSVAGLTSFTRNALDAADNLQKINLRIGASTEALSQYQYVADRTGVSFKTLSIGFQRAQRRIAEAAQGTGEARNALRELGLDVQKLNQLAPEEQFESIADAIQKIQNPADKTRLAMKLFDSEGVALLQTMQGGSEAIRKMRAEADELGLTLNQNTADAAARANDAMGKLGAIFDALSVQLVASLAPSLETIANWLSDLIPGAVQFAADAFNELQIAINKTASFVTRGLSGISQGLANAADFVGADTLAKSFDNVAERYESMSQTFERVAIRRGVTELKKDTEALENAAGSTAVRFGDLVKSSGIQLGITNTAKDAGRALNDAAKEAQAFAQSLESLTNRLDPISAETAEYAANVAILDRAWADGLLSGERYDELMQILATDIEAVAEAERKLQDDRQEALTLIKNLDPGSSIRDQILNVQRLRDTFPELSDALADVEFELQLKWDEMRNRATEAAETTISAWEKLGPTFSSAFEDAIVEGKNFRDVLKGLEQDIIRIIARQQVTKPLGDAIGDLFSGNGAFGSFLKNLIPFANGGSFTVGGSGGVDSQLVAFRASPNERVTVETPNQQRRNGNTYNFTFALPSDDINYRKSGEMVAREAMRYMQTSGAAV